ncbi:MAG: hypothetical protein LBF54_00875 [Holosporaceae bacterium]|nr:hypothetical protein [Holosporaceae bacterium]
MKIAFSFSGLLHRARNDEEWGNITHSRHCEERSDVEIIGYAEILIVSKTETKLAVFGNTDKEASEYFNNVIKEWMNVHGYQWKNEK